jgi:hypothetical protein
MFSCYVTKNASRVVRYQGGWAIKKGDEYLQSDYTWGEVAVVWSNKRYAERIKEVLDATSET